jgi:hypothetical protein
MTAASGYKRQRVAPGRAGIMLKLAVIRDCRISIEGAVSRVGSGGGESAACSWKQQ